MLCFVLINSVILNFYVFVSRCVSVSVRFVMAYLKNPVLYPNSRRMLSANAPVEPFPLVPAMCSTGNEATSPA